MNYKHISYLLAFYGILLLFCAAIAILYAGTAGKATAFTGASAGLMALTAGHFLKREQRWAWYLGLVQALVLFPLTAWMAALTYMQRPLLRITRPAAFPAINTDFRLLLVITVASLLVACLLLFFSRRVLNQLK